jgi:hypothetical protein
MRDYWDVVGALWDVIDIYEGPAIFRKTYNSVPREAGLMFAAHYCQSEVCSGGFEQLFWDPTGVLAPEAVRGISRDWVIPSRFDYRVGDERAWATVSA